MTPRFLEFWEMRDRLERFTYKPGWLFRLDLYPTGRTFLQISFVTEDSYNPGTQTKIGMRKPMRPGLMTAEIFDRWLLEQVIDAETHEAREWLKRDGEMIFNPHKNQRST